MNKLIPKILLLSFLSLSFIDVSGQKPNLKFKSLKISDGLINSTVQAIYEDSYGFIWLGTQHGLQRYDGSTFTTYTAENSDSSGLSNNNISDLCEDQNGDIWIATSIGLSRYSRVKDRIFRYPWKKEYAKQFAESSLFKILHDEDEADIIWMVTADSKLLRLSISQGEVISYEIPGGKRNNLVLRSLQTSDYPNHLLVGNSSLYVFDKSSGVFKELFALEQADNASDNRFNDLVFDPSDEQVVWCATGDLWGRGTLGGLLKYNLATNESEFLTWESRRGEIPDRHILTVCFSDQNKLWVGTRNHGVLLYDLGKDQFYNYKYNEYDEGSLVTENAIRAMHLDRSGTLWFGTWGDGISLLSPALQKFTHYKHLPNKSGGLPSNWITGITGDTQGNIWIGTKAGGLSKFDPLTRTFENHFGDFASLENPTEITYVFCDSRDNIWIGTYADALFRFNPATGSRIHYLKGTTRHSVSQNRISAITELKPGEIFISTYGGGLNIYDYDTDSIRQYVNNPKDSTSIPDNQVWLAFDGGDGNYYMGGNSISGLIRFDPDTEQFSEPLTRPSFNTFLNNTKNSQGQRFIDALSSGVAELIIKDTVSLNPLVDQTGNRIIGGESMVVDRHDNLWIGTTNGLVKFNPATGELTRYDPDDGLQGYYFFRYAAYAADDGALYFGGLNGLNTFNPDDLVLSTYQPPVVLTGFKLFQENLKIGEQSPLKQNIMLTDRIELDFNENDFSISFAGLDYSNPDKILYQYQLVNHDDEWINSGHFNVAGYTNMDPGTYTFQVKSTNGDGVWNNLTTNLEIIIHPPLWRTTAAYIGYLILFIIAILTVDRYQRKRLKEKEQAQARERELAQAKEIEKAYTELEAAHENLKTTQAQLIQSEKMASLGELTAGIAHEIQNPLNFVNNFSDVSTDLIEELKEELQNGATEEVDAIANDLKQNLEKISHHGSRASNIVKSMLLHSRAGSGEKEETDMNALADEYLRLAYHGLRAKDKSFNAQFTFKGDETLPKVMVTPQDFGRVLLNLINNAFYAVAEKARKEGAEYQPEVVVSTKKTEDHVEISIRDNGPGMPEAVKQKIFQPFFTTKPTGQGTGLGLSMSYDIITKGHQGEIVLNTEEGQGTEFLIRLKTGIA